MAFPVVAGIDSGSAAASTSAVIDLTGTGTVNAGDLVVMLLSANGTATHSWPGPSTEFALDSGGAGSNLSAGYFISVSGGETSITVTLSVSNDYSFYALRFTGAHASSAPEAATETTGSDASADPGNLTPSWGAEDTMWLAVCGFDDNTGGHISPFPSGYTNTLEVASPGRCLGVCRKEANAASENPGAFSLDLSFAWKARTIAIRPAVPGGTQLVMAESFQAIPFF